VPWLQLTFEITPENAERFSDCLSKAGASAITLQDSADQPLYEPPPGETPLWSHTRVMGLFEAATDIDQVVEQIRLALLPAPLPDWRVSPLEDKDWEREWMDNFKPMSFGERLWIVPSWTAPPHPEATNILLDPGLAFGTGTHPTTALCLRWLDEHCQQKNLSYEDVFDYGCGSGVLAVAAALLGAHHVWAVDNDPQALIATRDNAEKNGVSRRIDAILPDALPDIEVPLLLANILAGPLMELAEHFAHHTSPGGYIVLSGILEEQAEQVANCYQPWFAMEPAIIQDKWVRLSGKRLS